MNAKSTPRDVFLHLLAIITLYLSAVAFGVLIFQYVDLYFPDVLGDAHGRLRDPVRWAIAALVIVFPVYVWVSSVLQREMARQEERREFRIRKWLLYFTLFAAALLIIGDFVTLIYRFLNGDLTTRFSLKVLTVLFIAGAIYFYYHWTLRTGRPALADRRMRVFAIGVIGVVAAATVAGFFVAGSPFRERARRFDERRASDLQALQWQIIGYWQRKDRLPVALDELRDNISGFVPPLDPETGAPYEYQASGSLSFELCAAFKTLSGETSVLESAFSPKVPITVPGERGDSWSHGAGRTCFTRTIDPDLYGIEKLQRAR